MVRVCLFVLASDRQQTTIESALLALSQILTPYNPAVTTTEP